MRTGTRRMGSRSNSPQQQRSTQTIMLDAVLTSHRHPEVLARLSLAGRASKGDSRGALDLRRTSNFERFPVLRRYVPQPRERGEHVRNRLLQVF